MILIFLLLTIYIPVYHAPKRMILSESDSYDNDIDDAFDNDMMSIGNTSKVLYSNKNKNNENPTMINHKNEENHIVNVN